MLINCPECELQVSDKATSCPHCGYPIVSKYKRKQYVKNRRRRLPNGFGQISELKGKALRRPFRAMVTVGKNEFGRPICKLLKPVAYFETYNEAYEALVNNAKTPYEALNDSTLAELYAKWYEYHSPNVGASRLESIRSAWKKCASISEMKVREIKSQNIRDVLFSDSVPTTMKGQVKILLGQLFDYAIENDIVDKNYPKMVTLHKEEKKESIHSSFTDDELNILWSNKSNPVVKWILIQCYTGMRPAELLEMKIENIHLEEHYMVGGMKTEAGKNRVIPIHSSIEAMVAENINESVSLGSKNLVSRKGSLNMTYSLYRELFEETVKNLGLKKHVPHDPRKTFATLAKKYHVDEYAIKRIIGHAISDITESTYTDRPNEWLISEISKIVV